MIRKVQAPNRCPIFCNNKCNTCVKRYLCYTVAEGIVLDVTIPEWYKITNALEFKKIAED